MAEKGIGEKMFPWAYERSGEGGAKMNWYGVGGFILAVALADSILSNGGNKMGVKQVKDGLNSAGKGLTGFLPDAK